MLNVERESTRLLVIEDDYDLATVICAITEGRGCQARNAQHGSAALAIIRSWHPTIILSDLHLGGWIDGYDIAKQVRNMRGYNPVLVAVSGWGDPDFKAINAGFNACMRKPIDTQLLTRLLTQYKN